MINYRLCGFFILATLSLAAGTAVAWQSPPNSPDSWTRFRGNDGTGTAPSDSLPPLEWNAESDFLWRTALPGRGWSSPVYADGRIWLTTAVDVAATDDEIAEMLRGVDFPQIKTGSSKIVFRALCVDADSGKLLLDIELGETSDTKPINPMNSYASPTAAIGNGRVVCHFGNYGTWCLDVESGELAWKKEFVVDHSVGPGSSPVIVDGKVVIVCDGTDQQFIVAVDVLSGEEVWRTSRPPIRAENGEFRKAYCTPLETQRNGRSELVIPGAQWVAGYDTETGAENWRIDHGNGYSVTPMPVQFGEIFVCCTSYNNLEFVGVRTTSGSGELNQSGGIVWRARNAPAMSSPVRYRDFVYAVSDKGVLVQLNPQNGEVLTKFRSLANVSASPLLANGHLYLMNRDGKAAVIRCEPELETVFQYDFGAGVYASPVPIGNDLLVRTTDELIRIGGGKKPAQPGTF